MSAARLASDAASEVALKDRGRPPAGSVYRTLLGWAFALFSSVRVLTYLPTLWAIHASADSSQYSLWTWLTWTCSNATMAAWLYENEGRRCNAAIAVCIGNSTMCLFTSALIAFYRL